MGYFHNYRVKVKKINLLVFFNVKCASRGDTIYPCVEYHFPADVNSLVDTKGQLYFYATHPDARLWIIKVE